MFLTCLFTLCNLIMTCEPTHTASKERMVPELMSLSKCMPQLSITASKVQQPLHFTFSYVQPVTQRYQWKTVLESSLQSTQSPRKIRTIPFYKHTVGKPCLCYRKLTPWAVSEKKWDTKEVKGKSMMHALYVLQYAKRHVSGRSNVKEWKKSSP